MTARTLAFAAVPLAIVISTGTAFAQNYPAKPVRMIVTSAAGGPTDIAARVIAQRLSLNLGQPFNVENHPGESGNIGTEMAAKAAPDGYTIVLVGSGHVINPSVSVRISYDPVKDFVPVTLIGVAPVILLVNPSVPAKDVKELVGFIKQSSRQLNLAVPGPTTPAYLSAERFRLALGLDLVPVSLGGGGPTIQSLVGGHTLIGIAAIPPAVPHVLAGSLRALAVMSTKRSSALPDVPTMAEAGFPGYEAEAIQGVLVPANTPKQVVDLLHREIVKVIALPEIRQKLESSGVDAIGSTPEEFAARIKEEVAKWGKIVRDGKPQSNETK